MSDGQIGNTTTLAGASTGTVANIFSVSGPNQTVDPVEISSFDSVSAAKEYIAGLYDSGEITLQLNFDGSAAGTADALQTAIVARTTEVWTITYPDGSTDVATGFITALGKETPNGDKITQSVTIKFTGLVVFTDIV